MSERKKIWVVARYRSLDLRRFGAFWVYEGTMGLQYGWLRPATQEEQAKAQLASLEGL